MRHVRYVMRPTSCVIRHALSKAVPTLNHCHEHPDKAEQLPLLDHIEAESEIDNIKFYLHCRLQQHFSI